MPPATRFNTPATSPRSLRLGDLTLTVIPDGTVQLDPNLWLPGSPPEHWTGEGGALLDSQGFLATSVSALLVEHGDRALLIDAGFGPQHIPAARTIPPIGDLTGGRLLTSLKEAGREPSSIDTVAFTHLHDDHVGWAFGAGPDKATPFTGATFVASGEEWAGWTRPPGFTVPTVRAATGEEIFPGVTAWVTPGHTHGHTSYVLSSGGQRLIAFGDVFHSPAQLAHPDWPVSVDALPEQAVAARRRTLEELTRPDTWAFANHFADVHFGRVTGQGPDAVWEPLDTTP
ncbi:MULTISPECIES: MBL fold metallo-hydrolase [unclassified Streptomyces]|uniref:MBL fold metallo-hydrolase n=1 Tax=unclassified Streptomyces TaxID=2593676 RepID=UPI002E2B832C|nr:MBL fold metallo-hydrolase [Streptomyces sp. NBC_00223]